MKKEVSERMFQHGKIGQKSAKPLGYGVIKGFTHTSTIQEFSKGKSSISEDLLS